MVRYVDWHEIDDKLKTLPKGLCYGVPKNGIILALRIGKFAIYPEAADFILDDIIDSGRTRDKYKELCPGKPFITLYNAKDEKEWLHFPWEKDVQEDIQETVVRQLEFIGEDLNREGLIDTPKRVVKSWNKLYGGYKMKPKDILKPVFKQKYDDDILSFTWNRVDKQWYEVLNSPGEFS